MKSLQTYILESYDNFLRLSKDDKKKLLELDLEYGKIMLIARYETVCRTINNKDEAFEEFEERHIKNGESYYPVIEHNDFKYKKYDLKNRVEKLRIEFERFIQCPLSKYYIDSLDGVLFQIEYIENLNSDDYVISDNKKYAFDEKLLDEAFDYISNNEYKFLHDPEYKKDKTGKTVIKYIQKALDELDFDWKIIVDNDMPPRMGVNPEKTFRIRTNAKFSDVDLDSLVAHEIKGHVQKRYNAYQTGLFLFVFGLPGKNIFDEGMAFWNSLNLTKQSKPNAMFSIYLSYIVCYYCSMYDFCEAFDKLKELVSGKNVSDNRIFTNMLREKRSTIRTDRLGYWSGDIDYLRGFKLIDEMTTEEREKIMKWNVGPKQYYMIDMFEKFINVNDFKPISNTRLEQIKKDYKDLKT